MKGFVALVISFAIFCSLCLKTAFADPYVITSQGPIKGLEEKGVEVFRGIRYAKIPKGRLRFAPPEPAENFSDTFDATSFCQIPVQPSFLNHSLKAIEDEDCLCLNIYRPKGIREGEKLPVYVWIYGGAFVSGASSLPLYDGTSFARNKVIFVSINYRLNALGFYASESTLKQYGTTGNWGILDMIEALSWVHSHIEDFGGDKNNVTIGGESAGAYACSALVLSKKAAGLFNKVILESGTLFNYPIDGYDSRRNNAEAMQASKRFASYFNASDDASGLELLRELDPVLIAYHSGFNYDMLNNTQHILKPYFDGAVLPSDPLASLYDGDFNKVDVLLGYNTNEGTMFTNPKLSQKEFLQSLSALFGKDRGQAVFDYFDKKNGSVYRKASDFVGDMMFNLGMKMFADKLSENSNVYMYHFAYGSSDVDRHGGVGHAKEIAYAFNNLKDGGGKEQNFVADSMHERFVNFIKHGDPNLCISDDPQDKGAKKNYLVQWPRYDRESPMVMRFDRFSGAEAFELKDELEFLLPYFVSL